MKLTVRYFASIREALGKGSEVVETEAQSVDALRQMLIARGDAYAQSLARGKAVRVAIDKVMASDSDPLHEGCEVAFFPPVTGG
ncbi:molybdopterin converting factor subunit 1 [Caenimonas sp. SL110]|uniref:molybdopterin converting factor subunit 1 n=1 Tax=Caenimonas sp. SL110 TaxID=1450524 RepID=UPI0006535DFC|nr:molybdopterin converting factor subunit 1 [Caenimonas sp. SL110]